MVSFLLLCSVLAALLLRVSAVTLTTTSTAYTVDAESANSFQFTVTRSSCDITSILYRGSQVQYQGGSFSQIGSGLGTATVSAKTITADDVDYVMITCETATLTHYYVVRDTDSTLHMATFVTAEPTVGELRWIGRLVPDLVPDDDVSQASDTADGTAIEGSDVFLVGDETRSKFYSSERFIDDQVHCLSGSTMKACMLLPGTAYETSSGGPFHRDINTNPAGDSNNMYFYMNSGHVQLESYRTGLYGPYALVFSRSGTPAANTDLSFWENFGVSGYVAAADRGFVIGKANGIDSSTYPIVVHWFNDAAQYWAYADSSTNDFSSPAMKPGSYEMVLYQDELEVANATGVVVTAGGRLTHNIDSTWTTPATTLFQIGDWDGQPTGFRNADLQLRMHPSDERMASWGPLTYTVGSSALTDFPMAIFKEVNAPVTISFTLTAAQASGAATLRIGTTLSFAGGRPIPVVNSQTYSAPPAPVTIDSRGVTRGAYRGWGDRYDFAVSAGTLVAGTNKITIDVASGSSGSDFLEPNFIFDAVHLFR